MPEAKVNSLTDADFFGPGEPANIDEDKVFNECVGGNIAACLERFDLPDEKDSFTLNLKKCSDLKLPGEGYYFEINNMAVALCGGYIPSIELKGVTSHHEEVMQYEAPKKPRLEYRCVPKITERDYHSPGVTIWSDDGGWFPSPYKVEQDCTPIYVGGETYSMSGLEGRPIVWKKKKDVVAKLDTAGPEILKRIESIVDAIMVKGVDAMGYDKVNLKQLEGLAQCKKEELCGTKVKMASALLDTVKVKEYLKARK